MNYLMQTRKWNIDHTELIFEPISENELAQNIADIGKIIYSEIQKSQLQPISSDDHFIATESQPLTNTSQNEKDEVA